MHSFLVLVVVLSFVSANVRGENVKWCCIDTQEKAKCDNMTTAVAAKSTTNSMTVECIQGNGKVDCVNKVVAGEVDVMSMDGGEIIDNVGKLWPVTAEIYDSNKPDLQGAAYYAVAFVKKDTEIKLSNLKGKKTCHTGAGRSAGWNIPMGYLFSQKYIDWNKNCNQYQSAAKYFKESCVPGVKDIVKDGVDNLCGICNGTGADKCKAESAEPYYSYTGAFKCMYDGAGDVAFVKQSTFADSSNVGIADDYRLLCKDGTKKAIDEFKTCNLGKNPAHAVMTSNKDKRNTYSEWLLKVDQAFGLGTTGNNFWLYKSTSGKDLLFKDTTKALIDVTNSTAKEYLGDDYIKNSEGLKDCVPSSASGIRINWFIATLALLGGYFLY